MAPGHRGESHVSGYVSPVAKDWTDKPQLGQIENPLQTHTVGKRLARDKGMPTPTTAGRVLAALSTHISSITRGQGLLLIFTYKSWDLPVVRTQHFHC